MGEAGAKLAQSLHDWFTTDEGDFEALSGFARDMGDLLERSGAALTPLMTCRVVDLATWWLLARRIQRTMPSATLVTQDDLSEEDAKYPKWRLHPGVEALAKTWERLRKAMKELTEACEAEGTPLGKGLADTMKPILKRAEGVLEDAAAFEQKRQQKGKPGSSKAKSRAKSKPGTGR